MQDIEVLKDFLSIHLGSSDGFFERFREIPGAVYRQGEKDLERFLYIEGKRPNKVLLVAHADTVWDKKSTKKEPCHTLRYDRKTGHQSMS